VHRRCRPELYQLERDEQLAAGESMSATPLGTFASAFVPVVQAKTRAELDRSGLGVLLPNGVRLEMSDFGPEELPKILRLLWDLPCFGSTPG